MGALQTLSTRTRISDQGRGDQDYGKVPPATVGPLFVALFLWGWGWKAVENENPPPYYSRKP